MSLTPQQIIGNWRTDGVQFGWGSNPTGPSGAWKGNLSIQAGGTTAMNFTWGNVAPSRGGNWSLNGNSFSIIDGQGTLWKATVMDSGQDMSGNYDSGPAGAAGGSWHAQKV